MMKSRSSRIEKVPIAPMKKVTIFGPVMPTKGERLKAVHPNLPSESKPVLPWNSGPGLINMRNAISGTYEKARKERPHSKTKASGYQKKTRLNCNHLDPAFVRKEPDYLREITENTDFRSSHVIPSVIREPRGAINGRKIYDITEDDKSNVKKAHKWMPTGKVHRRARSFENLPGITSEGPSENNENSEGFRKTVTFADDTLNSENIPSSDKDLFNRNISDGGQSDSRVQSYGNGYGKDFISDFSKDSTLPSYLSSNVYSDPENITTRLGSNGIGTDKDAGLDYCPFCEHHGNNTYSSNRFSYLDDCPLCDERSRVMDFRYDRYREPVWQRDVLHTKDSTTDGFHSYKEKNRVNERGRRLMSGKKSAWSDDDFDYIRRFREKNGLHVPLHSCSNSKHNCIHQYTQNDRLFLEPTNTRKGTSVCSECGAPQPLSGNGKDPYMYHITLQDCKKRKDLHRSESSDERRNFSEIHPERNSSHDSYQCWYEPSRQEVDDTSKHIYAQVKGRTGHILERNSQYSCRSDEADELRNRTIAFHKRRPSSSMALLDHIQ